MKYLLLPIIALLLIIPAWLLKKKNAVLDNKTLILFVLLSGAAIGIQGLWGIIGDVFSPYYYVLAQAVYLIGGVLYVQGLARFITSKLKTYVLITEIVVTLLVLIAGMGIFSILYNLLSPISNGLLASSCCLAIVIPLLFYWTYLAYLHIPVDIYKIWQYNPAIVDPKKLESVDFTKLMVLELEFGRNIQDEERIKVQAKAQAAMNFGEWFGIFIENYNRKFPDSPIVAESEDGNPHSWIFYIQPSFFRKRKYIDPDFSIQENRIRERYTIITKRVTNNQV
ncbi:TssN family type VI secretion system protein [Cytophagaceae bacterium DM2B3-1]|uniref:TssN family type VI secretion system protein n=1 Tax=Xanthocytophaga flava TaxID=3048013 RepID=A0ABT7CIT2_9BACT|nr:TssN family type VI secretion system protein [Xanthocytophaga flavus]